MLPVMSLALETAEAVSVLIKVDRVRQALVILYSAIDTIAWANKPSGDVYRSDFKEWVQVYMEPDTRLGCTAEDLYAARCAVLHSGTAESTLSRQGSASPLWYVTGRASKATLEQFVASKGVGAKVVPVVEILAAFVDGTKAFCDVLAADVAKSEQVQGRISKWLGFVPVQRLGREA